MTTADLDGWEAIGRRQLAESYRSQFDEEVVVALAARGRCIRPTPTARSRSSSRSPTGRLPYSHTSPRTSQYESTLLLSVCV